MHLFINPDGTECSVGFLFFLEVVTTPDTLTGKKERRKKKKHNCKISQSPHSSFLFGFFKILKSSVEFAGEGSWMDTFGLYIVGTGGCALCTFDYFIRSKAF